MTAVDLDQLEKALAKVEDLPWAADPLDRYRVRDCNGAGVTSPYLPVDAAAIVAAVNAAPALIAELRDRRAEADGLREQLDRAHALARKLHRESLTAEFAVERVKDLIDPEAGMATGNGYDGTRLFDERDIRNALDGGS